MEESPTTFSGTGRRVSDGVKCTECGYEFNPDCTEEDVCETCQCEEMLEAGIYYFTNCNVCGIRLQTVDECRKGVCERCCVVGL